MAKKTSTSSRKTETSTDTGKRKRVGKLSPPMMTSTLNTNVENLIQVLSNGYSDINWYEALQILNQISDEAPRGVVDKLGTVWSNAYADHSNVRREITDIMREHYPSNWLEV